RMKRVWEMPEAGVNLPNSLLLRPALPAEQAQLCTLAAAVAAARAIEDCGLPARIKWPNDVVIGSRKCVGILSEMVADMDGVQFIVMGVGFNVNQRAFPEELKQKATSLLLEKGETVPRGTLLLRYLSHMEEAMEQLESGGMAALMPDYLSRSVTLGSRVEVIGTAERFVGQADGLDETGALLVTDDEGRRRRVLSADVSVRGVMGYV
ncbi:MAG: biotin--[acetyl-CoA-carboxylase] ligase, partial [Eubacteriales bacterium]|nr:biotin--[acetyl-CoA-carboxylase] ligase [Eubacteriales bacterium]